MGPGSFEDSIRKQFDGKTAKAPHKVWSGIEGKLNSDLISRFQSSHSWYKWTAVAAIFIAMNSLAIHYLPTPDIIASEEKVTPPESYNALLSDNDFSGFRIYTPRLHSPRSVFNTVAGEDNPVPLMEKASEEGAAMEANVLTVEKKRSKLSMATIDADIYPYHSGLNLPVRSVKSGKASSQKIWAGIEAGAGNFNSSLDGNSTFGSVNTQNLASAVGTEDFINPTTIVNPQIDPGVATTVGLDFGVKLGRRWSIESGVSYTNVDSRGSASINVLDTYQAESGDISGLTDELGVGNPIESRGAPLEVQENYDHEIDLQNNIRFTSIPIKAGYFIMDKRMSLRVNAGLSANYFMSSSLSDPGLGIISSSPDNLYNNWSFDGIGGLEFGYSIFDKFNLTIEPNYRHAITPLSNSAVSPSRFVIQTGLRYTIK